MTLVVSLGLAACGSDDTADVSAGGDPAMRAARPCFMVEAFAEMDPEVLKETLADEQPDLPDPTLTATGTRLFEELPADLRARAASAGDEADRFEALATAIEDGSAELMMTLRRPDEPDGPVSLDMNFDDPIDLPSSHGVPVRDPVTDEVQVDADGHTVLEPADPTWFEDALSATVYLETDGSVAYIVASQEKGLCWIEYLPEGGWAPVDDG